MINKNLIYILCIACCPLFFIHCGRSGFLTGPNTNSTSEQSANSGSVAFSVDWKADSNGSSGFHFASSFDCTATGVNTIEVQLSNSAFGVVSGGPWTCSAHSGTINNVSAGLWTIDIYGKDSAGFKNYFSGSPSRNITVTANLTTDVGTITLTATNPFNGYGFSTDSGKKGEININWNDVSGATSYNIYWSTSSGVSKASYTGKISNATRPYYHTGLTSGTTYYYVLTAVNSYGESRETVERGITAP